MSNRLFFLLFCLICVSFAAIPTMAAMLNPHIRPEPCLSCHTKVPTEEEAKAGEYFHIKETIDATCKVCHTCCRVGTLHLEMLHPSDVKDWDRSVFVAPKTLPLHNGKITCNTCHLHRAPDEPTIFMLRNVKVGDKFGMDWTELCLDCHVGY